MTFPEGKFNDIGSYADAYFTRLRDAAASVGRDKLARAAGILIDVYTRGGFVPWPDPVTY